MSKCKNDGDWKKMIRIWCTYTDLPKERQRAVIFLSQNAVLELSEGEISPETGVKNIIDRLDKLFKKDETLQKYQALEAFGKYRRSTSSSIQEFLNEFEKQYNKIKSFGTTMSDDILAYRLLKSTNLSEQHEQLAKATVSNLKYDLILIFGDLSAIPTAGFSDSVKIENVNQTKHESKCQDALYTRGRARGASRGRHSRSRGQYSYQRRGQPSKGAALEALPHLLVVAGTHLMVKEIPPNVVYVSQLIIGHKIVLTKSRMNMTSITVMTLYCSSLILIIPKLQSFVAESWNAAVLDCGASKYVVKPGLTPT